MLAPDSVSHIPPGSCSGVGPPGVRKCFYVEAQRGAYTHDIFAVELFDDRGFTRVVETAVKRTPINRERLCIDECETDRNSILISLSFRRFLRMIVSRPMMVV